MARWFLLSIFLAFLPFGAAAARAQSDGSTDPEDTVVQVTEIRIQADQTTVADVVRHALTLEQGEKLRRAELDQRLEDALTRLKSHPLIDEVGAELKRGEQPGQYVVLITARGKSSQYVGGHLEMGNQRSLNSNYYNSLFTEAEVFGGDRNFLGRGLKLDLGVQGDFYRNFHRGEFGTEGHTVSRSAALYVEDPDFLSTGLVVAGRISQRRQNADEQDVYNSTPEIDGVVTHDAKVTSNRKDEYNDIVREAIVGNRWGNFSLFGHYSSSHNNYLSRESSHSSGGDDESYNSHFISDTRSIGVTARFSQKTYLVLVEDGWDTGISYYRLLGAVPLESWKIDVARTLVLDNGIGLTPTASTFLRKAIQGDDFNAPFERFDTVALTLEKALNPTWALGTTLIANGPQNPDGGARISLKHITPSLLADFGLIIGSNTSPSDPSRVNDKSRFAQ